MRKIFFYLPTLLILIFLGRSVGYVYAVDKPTIGVIHFPGWFSNPPAGALTQLTNSLAPKQWHFRLPFYTVFSTTGKPQYYENTQAITDLEIAFAKAAGIAYFAYDYAGWTTGTSPSNGYWLYYYFTSPRKNDVNFCLILTDFAYVPITKQYWETTTVPAIVKLFREPTYQKVLGGRPLVYVFGADKLSSTGTFGSISGAKTETDFLRQQSQAAGAGNPYMVAMAYPFNADLSNMGFDAVSQYTAPGTNTNDHSYQALANGNLAVWNSEAALGFQVIPTVNTGWDWRPWTEGQSTYTGSPWYDQATPDQIKNNLQNAINWLSSHPQNAAPNSILIYAWNEIVEGGWLTPTLYEGDARLQAIAKLLTGTNFSSPRYKGRDVNGDGKIDIFDYNLLVASFGKNLDPIPNNADINANGKVDIFDYNILIENFGK
jgi:hypothetical protein